MLTQELFKSIKTSTELIKQGKKLDISFKKHLWDLDYTQQLKELQAEMVELQNWIIKNKKRVAIIFEGRDAAGKGGAIKRFTEHLNPRAMRVVALSKPTKNERGQWYFRRYIKELPQPGEMVFFDRSWYNRAVVEPVMGFCDEKQYQQFLVQVPEFEHMLYEDGLTIIKFWFSISKKEQRKRFNDRLENPLKQWKISPIDLEGQNLWESYTYYKEQMFTHTHTSFCPWTLVKTNDKRSARLESMRHVLSQFEYEGKRKTKVSLLPDPNIINRFYRNSKQLDK